MRIAHDVGRRRPSGSFVIALLLSVLCGGLWLQRVTLLRGAADLWVVSDQITPADVVVVLGGGEDMRPFIAADLYLKGVVHKVLVSRVDNERAAHSAVPGPTEVSVTILRKLGVPDDGIELFGDANKNTRDEAIALKAWTKQHAVSAFIIPTEPFFSRRVSWVFQRELSEIPVHIEVPSFDPPSGYTRSQWWKTNEGVSTFGTEILKYLYYRFKYGDW